MRLIDADALIENHFSPSHRIALSPADKQWMRKIIGEAPTVDAVPVEWIQETMQLAEKVGAKEYAEHLEVLLDDWAERKEE